MPDKSIEVITQSIRLTHEGANIVLNRCIDKALEIGVPQNIAVVDNAGHLLCFTRLDGAKFHSIDTAIAKARASASTGCLLYTSPSPRDKRQSRMPSSA